MLSAAIGIFSRIPAGEPDTVLAVITGKHLISSIIEVSSVFVSTRIVRLFGEG